MKLVLKNKKSLNEQQISQDLFVQTKPWVYLKLTCPLSDYNLIRKVVESGEYKNIISLDRREERKFKLIEEFGFPEKNSNALILMLNAMDFIKPASDYKREYGVFSEDKAGIVSLTIKTTGGTSKVINHEGRTRTIARWLLNPVTSIRVRITQDTNGEIFSNLQHFPSTIVGQMDDKAIVSTIDFKEVSASEAPAMYMFLDFINSDGQIEAYMSRKVFDKAFTRIMKDKYPKRVFFKLKDGKQAKVAKNKKELQDNFEVVKNPKEELGVNAASEDAIESFLNKTPETFSSDY